MNNPTHNLTFGGLIWICLAIPAMALEPGQSIPNRLYAIGDSTTRAFNADFPLDNIHLSWVNGYHGFWQDLFGLPDVKSHNQRISANAPWVSRKNWTAAENGAEIEKMAAQASGLAGKEANYVTVMLGANDACQASPADLPTPREFRENFSNGMETIVANIPDGATVQVAAIPNVSRVYEIGTQKSALGIVDCKTVWSISGSCRSVLSSDATDTDREFVLRRVIAYNGIIQEVTEAAAAQNPSKFLYFTDANFRYPFQQSELSDLDCFHPSWNAQKVLSREIWNNGPFAPFQKGS